MNVQPQPKTRWVLVSKDPPAVWLDGETWFICPVKGFDCARVLLTAAGEKWALDVMTVHVWLHHRTWH